MTEMLFFFMKTVMASDCPKPLQFFAKKGRLAIISKPFIYQIRADFIFIYDVEIYYRIVFNFHSLFELTDFLDREIYIQYRELNISSCV